MTEPEPTRRQPGFLQSFVHAYDGLIHALSQRNMKFHFVSGVLVGLVGSGIPLGLAEKITLIFCVLLIFFAEILNTALEALVDLHTEDFRDLARVTKDTAAAGVLVLAAGTVVIFITLLHYNWPVVVTSGPAVARQACFGLPLAASVALLLRGRVVKPFVDHVVASFGLCAYVALATWTESYVFTALTGLLFAVAVDWARRRRRSHRVRDVAVTGITKRIGPA
jgi:diacylglycerol kinase (ATP)